MQVVSGLITVIALLSLIWWTGLLITQKGNLLRIPQVVFPSSGSRETSWRFADALVAFGLMQVVAAIGISVLRQWGWVTLPIDEAELTQTQEKQNFVSILCVTLAGQSIASGTMIAWGMVRQRTSLAQLGLNFHASDLVDGIKATILLLPPVLLISGLVNQIVPYEHVVLESLKSMNTYGEITLVFVTTALTTPFAEELIFRVLLISGLEHLSVQARSAASQDSAEAGYLTNTDDMPVVDGKPTQEPPIWPIFLGGLLFAVVHVGQGAAPIPLFFLAIGLGFVFQQTRRIWPVMIVHLTLNSLTLVATLLQTAQ